MLGSREWHLRARSPQRHLCDHWWNGKCFHHVESSFQSEMSPAQKGICYSWGLSLVGFCSRARNASHTALSLQHLLLPSFLCGSQDKMHYGVTISPSSFPNSSAFWHSLYMRSNSGCQNSWDKYIKSTLISFAVSAGCGIVCFLPQIDCSFVFTSQTTVSFYIRGSHISLLSKIIHGDINKACGSNRITYFGNRNSPISPVNKRPHGVCAVLSFE